METLVFDILIYWKWFDTNHKQLTLTQFLRVVYGQKKAMSEIKDKQWYAQECVIYSA